MKKINRTGYRNVVCLGISELFVSQEAPVEMLATGRVYLDISLIETDSDRHHGDTETINLTNWPNVVITTNLITDWSHFSIS